MTAMSATRTGTPRPIAVRCKRCRRYLCTVALLGKGQVYCPACRCWTDVPLQRG